MAFTILWALACVSCRPRADGPAPPAVAALPPRIADRRPTPVPRPDRGTGRRAGDVSPPEVPFPRLEGLDGPERNRIRPSPDLSALGERMKRCYARALHAPVEGTVELAVTFRGGRVVDVSVSAAPELDTIARCLAAAARSMRLRDRDEVTLLIPIVLVGHHD